MGKLETTQLGNVNVEEMDFTRKPQNGSWVVMESTTIENSSSSINSIESSSSSHLMEDASSSTHQHGPLFELSDLMIHLPLRRIGLSKHYQGKSQSFTSLTSVKNVDHLAKKMSSYQINKMMKPSKSYAGGLNVQESRISKKKSSRGSFLSFTRSSRPSTNNTYVRN